MTTAQLKQPFEIYEMNVGKFFPKTPASRMLQLLRDCSDHRVSNKEVRELLNINRFSAAKLLNKLCKAGLAQHSECGENGSKDVLLTDHGRKVLADLEVAIGSIPATIQAQGKSQSQGLQPEESNSEQPSKSSAPIRLDEPEAKIGTLISKLRAKPAGQSEEAKSELPPKRPPMPASGRRRHQDVNMDGQLSLFAA